MLAILICFMFVFDMNTVKANLLKRKSLNWVSQDTQYKEMEVLVQFYCSFITFVLRKDEQAQNRKAVQGVKSFPSNEGGGLFSNDQSQVLATKKLSTLLRRKDNFVIEDNK